MLKDSCKILLIISLLIISCTIGVSAAEGLNSLITNSPSQADYPEAGALVLKDYIVADYTKKEAEIYQDNIIKIFNKRGIKKFGEFKIRFDKSAESIEITEAKTIKPDGTVVKVKPKDIKEITPPSANNSVYSDARIKVVTIPALEPRSIIVCKYLRKVKKATINGEFSLIERFQYTEPIKNKKLIVKVPSDKEVNYRTKLMDLEPIIKREGEAKVYTWQKEDIPAIVPEPAMPPLMNVAPVVELSTLKSWSQVIQWYNGLIDNQYKVNDKLKTKIKELTKAAKSKEDKMIALYNYVTSQIRYVGLEYGISGYKPHTAIETYQNKYGDCKDKATLLIAMLKEIGVKAEPVLINRSWNPDLEIVSINQFNHMIVYLVNEDKYLDPTNNGTMYGVLPGDQGKKVLLPLANKLAQTPIMAAKLNQSIVKQEVSLKEDGSAVIDYLEEYTGVNDYIFKDIYSRYTPKQQELIIKQGISRGFASANGVNPIILGVDDLNQNLKVTIPEMKVRNYAKSMGNLLALSPMRFPVSLAQIVASEKRIYPIYLSSTSDIVRRVEIQLPQGYKVNYMPEEIKLENKVGKLSASYTKENNKIIFDFNLKINKQEIEVENYKLAKELLGQAGVVVQNQILVEKK
ncbi:transglutaminase superfamily protein [Orenia metallireducens]|uniref:Transglutaminase-like superfamily protein n=1 Tax=Orenia metallireducens TaxID=1413210 RepID=A0A285IM41_9FIRM|nr:DUF3857 domain-containing protein [Orenia metallireducens]PRX16659.1 transglutaminase superfamily protein [Orenia metallireducens]SNY48031.1 Transglutaminase-like superfamily protein [Orenia metallireducens]